jgi:predicted kinase
MKPYIFCCGLPGTGKSTSSKKLEKRLSGFVRVHRPKIKKDLGINPYGSETDEDRRQIGIAYHSLDICARMGTGMVYDRVGSTLEVRLAHYQDAKRLGKGTIVVYHTASETTARKRISERKDPKESAKPTNDPRKHEKYKKKLIEPDIDEATLPIFRNSFLIYNTEKNTIEVVEVKPEHEDLVEQIQQILLE